VGGSRSTALLTRLVPTASAWRQNTKPSFVNGGLLKQSISVSIQQQPVCCIIR
jgi:hypothetical protein